MKEQVVIIGAGVSGMTASLYLKRAGISCLLIEKNIPGGQINYTSTIENYPGFQNIPGSDLALNIYQQIKNLNIPILFDEVISIDNNKEILVNTKTKQIKTDYVIIATGKIPKKLNVIGEDTFKNKGISYCAICDGALYKNKTIAIVGAGESAIKESLYLSNIASKVIILNRRDEFRKKENLKPLLNKHNIEIKYNSEVKEFQGTTKLEHILLKDKTTLKADACFIFIGYIPKTDIFQNLNITNDEGYIIVDDKYQTKINNIYAIGDITANHISQIITCMNDAIVASLNIINTINK